MKKILLSILFLSGLSAHAQLTVFEDSFETYNNFVITGFGNWQTIDGDLLNTYTGGLPTGVNPTWANASAPMAFQIFTPSATTPQSVTNSTDACTATTESRNFDPKTGLKYAASWAGVPSTTGGATGNNDWLVSPVLNLGANNNIVRFWVKSLSDCYGLEDYSVGIYVGTGTPTAANFVALVGGGAATAPTTWTEKVINIPFNYSNQAVRIGIRYFSSDHYMFMVDDFKVTSSTLGNSSFSANKFAVYPNPATDVVTITNSDNAAFSSVAFTDVNGRTVKTVDASNVSELQINVSDLTSGIYFMNITSENGNAVKKFIKK